MSPLAPKRRRPRLCILLALRPRAGAKFCGRPVAKTCSRPIDGQLGRARWAGTGTAQESTALSRSGPGAGGLVPGPCQAPGRAWAAIKAHGTSTGPARQKRRHGEARPRPVRHGGGPMGTPQPPPRAPGDRWIVPLGRRSARWWLGYISPGAGRPPSQP